VDARLPEPRQRWRLVVARDAAARDMLHRDIVVAWETGLLGSGLPVSVSETATPRPRIAFAAQAPVGMLAERELIDVTLTELRRIHDVRATVEAAAPAGYRLVDLYDVWLSSPTLASVVTAGEYRATVAADDGERSTGTSAGGLAAADVRRGIEALLAADRIDVVRTRGHGQVTIDIRPHIHALHLVGEGPADAPVRLAMRLRLGGEGGIGRPDEVVAALGKRLGVRLTARDVTRERIVLADDPDAEHARSTAHG
jgi:radical SAM-linked protein